ncbi:hypothetical protein FQR65_LT16253 [Abscondita terminalis]|nr:hypothetical protein FQR65_LT16253 [Abscondita terminalis]
MSSGSSSAHIASWDISSSLVSASSLKLRLAIRDFLVLSSIASIFAISYASHNELGTKGWTIRYRPWELLYTEEYATKSEALKREQELKSYQGEIIYPEFTKQIMLSGSYPPFGGHQFESVFRYSLKLQFTD